MRVPCCFTVTYASSSGRKYWLGSTKTKLQIRKKMSKIHIFYLPSHSFLSQPFSQQSKSQKSTMLLLQQPTVWLWILNQRPTKPLWLHLCLYGQDGKVTAGQEAFYMHIAFKAYCIQGKSLILREGWEMILSLSNKRQ